MTHIAVIEKLCVLPQRLWKLTSKHSFVATHSDSIRGCKLSSEKVKCNITQAVTAAFAALINKRNAVPSVYLTQAYNPSSGKHVSESVWNII